jgi:hypothetical protein
MKALLIKDRLAINMARINRRTRGDYMVTITVSLPIGHIITLDKRAKQTGNNRSLALEYMISDWKRIMQDQKEAKQ